MSIRFSLEEFREAISGSIVEKVNPLPFKGVSIDTRTLNKGDLFFALRGNRCDGHSFVDEAFRKGAWGVVVEKVVFERKEKGIFSEPFPAANIIVVKDTLKALGDLALFYRRRHSIPVIAISGSCGKTTTREMVYGILSLPFNVLRSKGNYNSLIGLPLTLFELRDDHDVAVLEIGINRGSEEMRRLAEIALPDVAILTNIGMAHLEGLRDLKGVLEAKKELYHCLGVDGYAIINLDDPNALHASEGINTRRITYGIKNRGDVRLRYYRDGWDGTEYIIDIFGRRLRGFLKTSGLHNMYNLLASAAAAKAIGVSDEDIIEGLTNFEPPSGRMVALSLGDIKLIDDSYNANPNSMEMSLRTFVHLVKSGRKIGVLGDMMELGAQAEAFHFRLGRLIASLKIDLLFYVGEYRDAVREGAIASSMKEEAIRVFEKKEELLVELRKNLLRGDNLLIKASRGMKMEEIIKGLKDFIRQKMLKLEDGEDKDMYKSGRCMA